MTNYENYYFNLLVFGLGLLLIGGIVRLAIFLKTFIN